MLYINTHFSDASFGIFIENGSPDSYLMGLIDASGDTNYLNDTASFLVNATFNGSGLGNYSNAVGPETEDNLAELIVMIVTTVMLGFMILITVIGGFDQMLGIYIIDLYPVFHFSFCSCRKCFCYCCNYSGAESTKCCQLLGGIVGRC